MIESDPVTDVVASVTFPVIPVSVAVVSATSAAIEMLIFITARARKLQFCVEYHSHMRILLVLNAKRE